MVNSAGFLLVALCCVFSSIFFLLRRSRMARLFAFSIVGILVSARSNGAQAQATVQVLHSHVRPQVAQGKARPAGAMASDQRLSFSIVLPLRNQAELDQLLTRLYDPSSPDYRKFLSVTEFADRFGPTAQDYAAVAAYAQANGLVVGAAPANWSVGGSRPRAKMVLSDG